MSSARSRSISLGSPTVAGDLLATGDVASSLPYYSDDMSPRTRDKARVSSSRSLSATSRSQASIPNTERKVRDMPRFLEVASSPRWVHPQIT